MLLLTLYRTLYYVLTLFVRLWIYVRLFQRKEDPLRYRERFGCTRLKRPEGQIFWFHGASNGECLSFLSLIRNYQEKFPHVHFLITSQTRTSAELVKSKLPKKAMHQFIPLDHPVYIKRFLSHWKPDIAFWTESELWPNLLQEAESKMPLVLLNGRLSQTSHKNWQRFPKTAQRILSSFTLLFAQSKIALERFQSLGIKEAQYLGNLKFSGRPLEANPEKLKHLKAQLKDRPVWAASCTHPGEEEIIIQAHKQLKKTLKDVVTIIIPRHPHRADKLRQTWEAEGLSVAQRSHEEDLKPKTDIFLFDATGELGLIYRACPIVLMAGSLIEGIGGHNPLEAANLKCLLCVGPYTKNNQEIYDLFLENKACRVVTSPKDLSNTLLEFMENTKERDKMIKRSFDLATHQQNVLDTITSAVEKAGVLPC